jgi:hypothetical protein
MTLRYRVIPDTLSPADALTVTAYRMAACYGHTQGSFLDADPSAPAHGVRP